MSDAPAIFLSYAREDQARVGVLVKALEGLGWSVFWDRKVPTGSTFHKHIGEKLEGARCVVVAWTAASVGRDFVYEEATRAKERGVLRPVRFEDVDAPLGFGVVQAADLIGWEGNTKAPEFRQLVEDLTEILGEPPLTAEQPGTRDGEGRGQLPPWVKVGVAVVVLLAAVLLLTLGLTWQEGWRQGEVVANLSDEIDKLSEAHRQAGPLPGRARELADSNRGEGAPAWEEDSKLNRRVLIDGGRFLMGSPLGVGLDDERPQHWVRLSPFYMQEHEVTNEEFARFAPEVEFALREARHPVVNVTWDEAKAYAEWLGGRLPTEAEWEYAASGACPSDYCLVTGEETTLGEIAWYILNSKTLQRVALKKPNQNGLFDIYGNVLEWVADGFGPYAAAEQVGPASGTARVIRGGSWGDYPGDLRSAFRDYTRPGNRSERIGFRVVWSSS